MLTDLIKSFIKIKKKLRNAWLSDTCFYNVFTDTVCDNLFEKTRTEFSTQFSPMLSEFQTAYLLFTILFIMSEEASQPQSLFEVSRRCVLYMKVGYKENNVQYYCVVCIFTYCIVDFVFYIINYILTHLQKNLGVMFIIICHLITKHVAFL